MVLDNKDIRYGGMMAILSDSCCQWSKRLGSAVLISGNNNHPTAGAIDRNVIIVDTSAVNSFSDKRRMIWILNR